MFVEAYSIVQQFTMPVLVSMRYFDNTIESGIGSFVILNRDGWIATAAHVVSGLAVQRQHEQEIQKYLQSPDTVKINPKWIKNFSLWFGADHHRISRFSIMPEADLAIGRIENYDSSFCKAYPTLADNSQIISGKSILRMGFPFHQVHAQFDETKNGFYYDQTNFPIPFFPNEGIITRLISETIKDGSRIQWVETSSPGLRGQSGGPICDKYGNIFAIQSKTVHLELGFTPVVKSGVQNTVENQFLNVGMGIHVNVLKDFLKKEIDTLF